MNSRKHTRSARFLAFVLALSLLSSSALSTFATNDVNSLEQSTSDLKNELSDLNRSLKQLSSDIDSISSQITDMNAQIKEVQTELAIAKGEEIAQYDAMKTRIQFMYEEGNSSMLEVLFSAGNISEFVKRAEYFSTISEYDRNALKELVKTKEIIAATEEQLEKDKQQLTAWLTELNSKEAAIRKKIDDTSSELQTYTAKLDTAREEAEKVDNTLNKPVSPIAPSDIELFAALIECESGSTHYEGMLAVASVVMNRVNHPNYPNTIQGVIYAEGQFPPATNGSVERILRRGVRESCVQVAKDALAGKNNVGSCLNFRSASSGYEGKIIGSNVFF